MNTYIGPSRIHGIGLFADQFISEGMPVWRFQAGFDLSIEAEKLESLPEVAQRQFERYAYVHPTSGRYIFCFDNARFFNHSDRPNVNFISLLDESGVDHALQPIFIGDELTCDYRMMDEEVQRCTGCVGCSNL